MEVSSNSNSNEGSGQLQKLRRWSDEEIAGLVELKRRLAVQLQSIDQNPEVIGDRKLLRFFRGHNLDLDKTTEMVSKFIEWRKLHNVDEIRSEIVFGKSGWDGMAWDGRGMG